MKPHHMAIWGLGFLLLGAIAAAGCNESGISKRRADVVGKGDTAVNQESDRAGADKIVKTDEEWRASLTPEQYRILREKGTERAFTGEYDKYERDGTYLCAACGNELFGSETKYDSGSGWPSYWAPISEDHVELQKDNSLMMKRTEVVCSRCGGHLGHVFDDGPEPTGMRYCINSGALDFKPKEK